MNGSQDKTRPIQIRVVAIALSMAFASVGTSCVTIRSAEAEKVSGTIQSSRQMPDGMRWTTENLNLNTAPSYCYDDAQPNCNRYGRLYTWESARRACQSLGDGWRLPTASEWRKLAQHYGAAPDDSADSRKAAYTALLIGGSSGFNARLGGGRDLAGQYGRLEAHGFYWTASESDSANVWFYNFARGQLSLFRQSAGEKERAFSVRCVRE